jgi:uncharacterized Fe-S cluster-containing MiaB family protein
MVTILTLAGLRLNTTPPKCYFSSYFENAMFHRLLGEKILHIMNYAISRSKKNGNLAKSQIFSCLASAEDNFCK